MHKVMEMGHGVNAEGCRAITQAPVVTERSTDLGGEQNLS